MKKKDFKNYLIILLYGCILSLFLTGFSNIYGSSGDWLAQHTVIPEHFRQLFYQTGRLIPNLLLNLGGGQNIFNFSYYGLCSPLILLTYLIPNVEMPALISAISLITYLVSGLLVYKFLSLNNYSRKISLFLSLVFLSLSPITYHFHYHIMFVWYFPFLLLALIGVDFFLNKHQSFILIISIFLLILTNYYYGAAAMITIGIYALYKILGTTNKLSEALKVLLNIAIRFITPILLSAFILIPTAYALINTKRIDTTSINIINLFLIKIKEVFYSPYSLGISFIFILALLTNLFHLKNKKDKLFLNIVVGLITILPIVAYILNGFLYIRGKVLIPFIVLYLIVLADFFTNLREVKKLDSRLRNTLIIFIVSLIIMNITSFLTLILVLDISLTLFTYRIFLRKEQSLPLYSCCLLTIVLTTLTCNFGSNLLSNNTYYNKESKDKEIKSLLNKIKDSSLYRTEILEENSINTNKYWNNNINSPSLYSSTYNSLYNDFYSFKSGNNIPYRNAFIKSGALNPLFYNQMGVKYLVSKDHTLANYQKIASSKNYSLYQNNAALPLVYLTDAIGSEKEYKNLAFPYNLEYQIHKPITSSNHQEQFNSTIKELPLNVNDNYNLELKKDKKITYNLQKPINKKILLISFDMDYKQRCNKGDLSITINGIKNKLTCRDWYYYNQNTNFKYVIYNQDSLTKLDILITAGKYSISNIHAYTMDDYQTDYQELENLHYSKIDSTFIAEASLKKDCYAISSLPYDKGYTVLVDGKKVKTEKVNTAFLGFRVSKGKHLIKIKYNSPYYTLGRKISLVGLILMTIIIFLESALKFVKKTY